MIDKKKLGQAIKNGQNGQPKAPEGPTDPSLTLQLNNDELLTLINQYIEDKTSDNLNLLLNHIRKCRVLVPADMNEKNQPMPCFIKNPKGDTFMPVYTDMKQIPTEPKSPGIVNLPFLAVNNMVAKPEVIATGIVINPFTSNLVFKQPLVERIEEVEKKRQQQKEQGVKSVKLTEEQYVLFERRNFEQMFLPKKLYTEGADFVKNLTEQKESYVDQLFEESYQQKRLYPYLEEDFSVMAMEISDELEIVRVDLPVRDVVVGAALRVYVVWNPVTNQGRYFLIEKGPKKDTMLLGEINQEWKHLQHGESFGEGAELQQIIDLFQAKPEAGLS